MRVMKITLAVGQRFIRRLAGAPDKPWVLTCITAALTISDQERVTLTEELSGREIERTIPALTEELCCGTLISTDLADSQPSNDAGPLALNHLLALMTPAQAQHFKIRSAYTKVLLRPGTGLSHKSETFKELIEATYFARLKEWEQRVAKDPGGKVDAIERHPPSPHSAYRWCLAVRKAQGDLRVLAREVLVTSTRRPRLSKERELLDAYLTYRKAAIAEVSVAQLTKDFNRLLKSSNPLHWDELIDDLYRKAQDVAAENARKRSNRGSIRKKKVPTGPSAHSRVAAAI